MFKKHTANVATAISDISKVTPLWTHISGPPRQIFLPKTFRHQRGDVNVSYKSNVYPVIASRNYLRVFILPQYCIFSQLCPPVGEISTLYPIFFPHFLYTQSRSLECAIVQAGYCVEILGI